MKKKKTIYIYIYTCNHENNVCPPGYHHNGFVATHALGNKFMSCQKAIVVITGKAHCFHDCMYVTPILLVLRITYDHLYIISILKQYKQHGTHRQTCISKYTLKSSSKIKFLYKFHEYIMSKN